MHVIGTKNAVKNNHQVFRHPFYHFSCGLGALLCVRSKRSSGVSSIKLCQKKVDKLNVEDSVHEFDGQKIDKRVGMHATKIENTSFHEKNMNTIDSRDLYSTSFREK